MSGDGDVNLIGYARVSTTDQNLERQHDALTAAGCHRIFADKQTGRTLNRPELQAALDYLRPGDVLVVTSLDRLSRSMKDLVALVNQLGDDGINFKALNQPFDSTSSQGKFLFHIFAALAELQRDMIAEATREGLAAAAARGRHPGRPRVMTAAKVRAARALLVNGGETVASTARTLGVSRGAIYANMDAIKAG